jgi:hypothetical protein
MIFDLKYAYPRHSYAHGWLLSVDMDGFRDACERSGADAALRRYMIGRMDIEYGGTCQGTMVHASSHGMP